MTKACIRCDKPNRTYYKAKSTADGLRTECIDCFKLASDKRYIKNKDKINTANLIYYHSNSEKIRKQRISYYDSKKEHFRTLGSKYQKENRDKISSRKRERCIKDVNYRLNCSLRCRLRNAIVGNYKVGSAVNDLGCSIKELKKHLESKFEPGMTWDNWGRSHDKWQIDHIKPLCGFDLSDSIQFKEACHYTNLQPLWYKDHIIKTRQDIDLKRKVQHL